jgi:hypothetical protein
MYSNIWLESSVIIFRKTKKIRSKIDLSVSSMLYFKRLIGAGLVENFPVYYGSHTASPCSQEFITCPMWNQTIHFHSFPFYICRILTNIILQSTTNLVSFLSFAPLKTRIKVSPLSFLWYGPIILFSFTWQSLNYTVNCTDHKSFYYATDFILLILLPS